VGTRYRIRLGETSPWPDPASRFQPDGVHGPSEVIDPKAYAWKATEWGGVPLRDLSLYELHVGTFTAEGTFRAAMAKLPLLAELGVTAVELLPVAAFPGRRNWGYDGAALFAPSERYGRPDDLRAFVDEAHRLGLAVLLDAVYNHLGPDGAYLAAFGPFFSSLHETPWGRAVNLDGEHSAGVRRLLLDNALYWLREYRFDGLRLDATHALIDHSEPHWLAELADATSRLDGPKRLLIAEDDRNDARLITPPDAGGFGLDAVWADDLHHQFRRVLTGETYGYYAPFAGTTAADVAETLARGWYFDGRPDPTTGEPRGTPADAIAPRQTVICLQNHDQIGNRPLGDRLHTLAPPDQLRAATALLLLAPQTPLLFMGQEWAASTPFRFFTDHHPALGQQVREGRKREFAYFPGFSGDVPDPQAEGTFRASTLNWDERDEAPHARMLRLHHHLLALRRRITAATNHGIERAGLSAEAHADGTLTLARGPYRIVVAFEKADVPRPPGRRVWSSERKAYAEITRPVVARGDRLHFARAGAVVYLES
jgi:maltooligosyltrehalose trehalohydrolase